jgi:hypothetical protein
MSKLPAKIRKRLKKEAQTWDVSVAHENPQKVEELLEKAISNSHTETYISLRVDPFDVSG